VLTSATTNIDVTATQDLLEGIVQVDLKYFIWLFFIFLAVEKA
jgi:hypothetical protein